MKLLNVPHYQQPTINDCQGACAIMVVDFLAGVFDLEHKSRIQQFMKNVGGAVDSESGQAPPLVTGKVALQLALLGFSVEFYSIDPYSKSTAGLAFLENGPWNWSPKQIEDYAARTSADLSGAMQDVVDVRERDLSELEIEELISAGIPVVAIVDHGTLLGSDCGGPNHALVITGINMSTVWVQDPNTESTDHIPHDRQYFFAAHRISGTDCDAYIVSKSLDTRPTTHDECMQ